MTDSPQPEEPLGLSDDLRVCAVCGRVLDVRFNHDGSIAGYFHFANPDGTYIDYDVTIDPGTGERTWIARNADHVAVAVRLGEVHTLGRCDFCGAPDPGFVLPVSDFVWLPGGAPGGDDAGDKGNWSCCEGCKTLIECNRWNVIERNGIERYRQLRGHPMPPQAVTLMRRMYRLLRAHITGPVRPLVWPQPPS